MPDALDTDKSLRILIARADACNGVHTDDCAAGLGAPCDCGAADLPAEALIELDALAARAERYEKALRRIACFDEGPEVTGAFDEPGAAAIAREALALPAADRRAENDKHE